MSNFHEEYEKKEKCGLFGIWGTSTAAHTCYQGLFAQQHRGQESAGIAVTDGNRIRAHTGMGLVSQVFSQRVLKEDLPGHGGIGHVRYSTTGESRVANAQPLMREYLLGPVAVAHNGNLIDRPLQLRQRAAQNGEPRPGNLGSGGKVHHPQRFAEFEVLLRRESQLAWLTPLLEHDIGALVRAIWHVRVEDVGQPLQHRPGRAVHFRGAAFVLGHRRGERGRLRLQRRAVPSLAA